MATPTRTVQFRTAPPLIKLYEDTGVPAFAIKAGSAQPVFKYEGSDMNEGTERLSQMLQLILHDESAAIYTLCIYEEVPGGRITDKLPCGYAWNFRLNEYQMGQVGGRTRELEMVMQELQEVKKSLKAMQEEKTEETDKLGMIGEILKLEPLQPIFMGIAEKVAAWINSDPKIGELRRVSGIANLNQAEDWGWMTNEKLTGAITRLSKSVTDLPDIMDTLATTAETSPKKFAWYLKMVRSLK